MNSQSKVSQGNFSYDKEPPQDVILDSDEPQGGDKFMKMVGPEKRTPRHFMDYDGAGGNYAALDLIKKTEGLRRNIMKNSISLFLKTAGEALTIAKRSLKDFNGNPEELEKLKQFLASMKQAQQGLSDAATRFYNLNLSKLTPDGKLGGRSYVSEVDMIRENISDSLRLIHKAVQSVEDEIGNNPQWKKAVEEMKEELQKKSPKEVKEPVASTQEEAAEEEHKTLPGTVSFQI